MKTIYEQMGGTYSKVGDYYLPNMDMKLPKQSESEEARLESSALKPADESGWIGKYGLMRKTYLKEHRPVLYSELIRTGKLWEHLAEVGETCSRQVELLTTQMAEREGVTETLKASNPMAWVAQMNGIKNRAEEIALQEHVYV